MSDQDTLHDPANKINAHRSWYTTWWGFLILFVLMIIGSFAVAFGFSIRQQVLQIRKEQQSVLYGLENVKVKRANDNTPIIGSSEAPIKMVVFSDFNCQYSKKEYPIIRDFIFKHSDKVQLVYHDFPVVTENSLQLALAGRCANEQKMFWPMHDYLFEHQGEESITMIMAGAKSLSLDLRQFTECLKNEKHLSQIRNDLAEGMDLQIQGTPNIFMNNYKLPAGQIPEDILEKIYLEINKKN